MPYILGAIILGVALYFVVRWMRAGRTAGATERCPRCGGRLVFRERHFRGAAIEYFYECQNADCGYRRSV